jgi:hypothetical protein
MQVLQNNLKKYLNISMCVYVKIIKRSTGLMAAGTQIPGICRKSLALILTHHNIFLRNLDEKHLENSSEKLITLVQNVHLINSKYTQHVMSVMYPKMSFSLLKLQSICPKVIIVDPKSALLTDFSSVIAAVVANDAIKNNIIFKEGNFYVLGFPDPNKQKKIINSAEYQDTGQPNPDYYYQFNKSTGIWQRYYDLKTGKIAVNKGHILCVREGKEYEKWSEYILKAQRTSYPSEHPLRKYLEVLINNKNMSWGERNDALHVFLKENLAKLPDINPSLILKSELLYEIDQIQPQKSVFEAVNCAGAACMESYENSVNVIAESIYAGGKKCIENFSKIPGANPGIKKILAEMSLDSINYLKTLS